MKNAHSSTTLCSSDGRHQRLGRPDLRGDEVEERERGDLGPGDDRSDAGGGSVPERQQDAGDQDGDEACEVLGLGERLEHPCGRVEAQVVEDREVEDQKRQEGAGQAEQQLGGAPRGLVDVGVGVSCDERNIT